MFCRNCGQQYTTDEAVMCEMWMPERERQSVLLALWSVDTAEQYSVS